MTADEMRAIVTRFSALDERYQNMTKSPFGRLLLGPTEQPPREHVDFGAVLALLRAVAARVQPRRGLLANECPLCGVMGSDAHQRHLSDCPAPVLEVLRG